MGMTLVHQKTRNKKGGFFSMEKWADYLVSAVRYSNSDRKYISQLRVHKDEGESVGADFELYKNDVVSKINEGYSFVTIIKNSDKKWAKGQKIIVFSRNGINYLRTDANNIEADNLGELPHF